MIDHVSIGVCDLARATAFYEAVLGTIELDKLVTRGYRRLRQALS